jgi:hypothetical protein
LFELCHRQFNPNCSPPEYAKQQAWTEFLAIMGLVDA